MEGTESVRMYGETASPKSENRLPAEEPPPAFRRLCSLLERMELCYQTGVDETGCFFAETNPLVPLTVTFLPDRKSFSLIAVFPRKAAFRHRERLPALLCRINLELTEGCFGTDGNGTVYYRDSLRFDENADTDTLLQELLHTACRRCAERAGVVEALADNEGVIDAGGVWHLEEEASQ